MKTIKSILCPVDFFDFQPEAAEFATTLAKALDAKITILYVFEPLTACRDSRGVSFAPHAVGEAMRRKAEAKTSKIIFGLFNSKLVKGEIVFGQAADQIHRKAEEFSADIIVMASHGRLGLDRIIYGSVTSEVIANVKIPVLVIQPTKE